MRNPVVRYLLAGSLVAATFAAFNGCGTVPRGNVTTKFIHVENQNRNRVRAYIASERAPEVRVLLGTVEPYESDNFPLPCVFQDYLGLVLTFESGRLGGPVSLGEHYEHFETSYILLPAHSTLIVTVRDPMDESDYSVSSFN